MRWTNNIEVTISRTLNNEIEELASMVVWLEENELITHVFPVRRFVRDLPTNPHVWCITFSDSKDAVAFKLKFG